MPDLEPVRGMANGGLLGPRFGGDRRRPGMPESSVFACDRSETCNGEPNGQSVDRRQKALGIDNRKFRDRSRIGGEVSGSNLPKVSHSKLEKACRKLKGGVVKPTELVMRLVQLVKGSKPRKCLDLVPEEVSESPSKGKKRRKNIESESEACGFTGSGEGVAVGFREQMAGVDMEASDFGNNKAGSSSMDFSQINGYCGAMKQDAIANGEAHREITEEGKKSKKYRAAMKSVMGSVEEKSEPKRTRKGKVQCGESLGSHEAGDDRRCLDEADREGRNNKRKRHRNSGNAVADMVGSKVTGSIADDVSSTLKLTDPFGKSQLANEDTSQAHKSLLKGRGCKITGSTTDDVSSTLKFTEPVNKRHLSKQDMSQENKLLLKGRGRPKKEPLSNKRTKCSPRTNAEEQVALKGITENGFLEKHKMGKAKRVKATSDESKINGFYSPSKEKGTFTYADDIGPLGEAALSKVEKVEDGFDGEQQATLTHDKTIAAADLPMVEGIIVHKSSPTVGEDVSSVLTEAEGNKDPKGLGTEPEKPRKAWVSCDDCKKWRHISVELADHIETTGSRWSCRDNLDKDFADCSVPQEKSNAEINAELNISEISNCDKNDNADGQVDSKALHRESNEVRQKNENVWTHISHSVYKHRSRKAQTIDEIMVCQCKPPEDGSSGCGDGCWNRLLNIECVPGTCPCGDQCSNQRFQKRSYANVGWFRCGKKGFGLQVLEDVPCGTFIIEYVGEVLDMKEHNARQQEYAKRNQKHFYFMTLNSNEVIDACVKGNLGRYINHSCNPNCQTEKWTVNGEVCIGFFALRDLIKGEEVTFDYNYVRFLGSAAKKCECGFADCRGFIGGDPTTPQNVVSGSEIEDPEPIVLTEECEDLAMVVDIIKPSQVGKLQDFSEAKIQISERLHSDSIAKKGLSSPSNEDKNSNDENKGTAKKLKRSKAVSTVEKHISSSAKRLTINTSERFEGVEEKLNEMLDGSGGIAKRRDVAKHYLKLLVLTAASGDASGEASGSTRDLSMVLDALLKTESRTVLMDIADKNGLQLLHNLIKQHSKDYRKTPIIRKLLKILHIFALKKVITSEQINSIPSRKGVESFEESICSLTFHADKEVKIASRLIREDWGISPIGKSLEGKQTQGGSRATKSYNSSWRKDKFPPNGRASSVNRFKVPGKHVEGSITDGGQDIVEKGDIQVRDEKTKKRIFEHDGEWNSSNQQISSRKGKEKSNLEEPRQFPQNEKQCLDSLSKDPLLGDPSNVLEDNGCGPFSHSSISEGGKWTQGSRRNIHYNTGRGHPRYYSSSRSTPWHDTPPHKTGPSPAANPNMLDRKIEPQHGAQLNTVTTTNSNQPLNSLSAPTLVGTVSGLPQGNGVVDRPTGDILFPNTNEAIGVPLEVFDYVHGLTFRRPIENKATRGHHPREVGGVASATPCRIPCEHFSMQPTTNTMQPFHSSGGPASVYGFPLDPAAHNSHPFASALTAPVRGPSNLHSGIRPPQFHHLSQLQANQIHRHRFIHGSEKSDWAVVEQNNILEPEPPVPGLSPPHLPEGNSVHYHSPFGPVHEINKMRDMFAKKDLPYKRDSCSILRNNGNNQDLSPNLSAQDSVRLNSNCDTENQSAKTCILDGLSSQMSCPVDGNTASRASMNTAIDCSSQRSSPLCMAGVSLNLDGKHFAETVASSNNNHSKFSYPCDLKGARQNNFSSKHDVKVEACGPIIDGQNFIHNGEHREISKFSNKSIESLRTDRDSHSSHDKGMPRSFDAAGRNLEIQQKYPSNKVLGYVEDESTDRGTQDTKIDRDSCPDGEKYAPPVEGGRSSDIGKLE